MERSVIVLCVGVWVRLGVLFICAYGVLLQCVLVSFVLIVWVVCSCTSPLRIVIIQCYSMTLCVYTYVEATTTGWKPNCNRINNNNNINNKNANENGLKTFRTILEYQISWKSLHQFSRYFMRTQGRMGWVSGLNTSYVELRMRLKLSAEINFILIEPNR
jgi:hypothetical protein